MVSKKRQITTAQKVWGQDKQDEIFRKMSADKKIAVGASLWRLAKEIAPRKVLYGDRIN